MSCRIAIWGTGAIALDIGMYLLQALQEARICWVGSCAENAARIERKVKRRLGWSCGDFDRSSFSTHDQVTTLTFDWAFECTHETIDAKRKVYTLVETQCGLSRPLLTASSSILPDQIGPRVVGVHVFRPLAFTRFAEIIFPKQCPEPMRAAAMQFMRQAGLRGPAQNADHAFALNRLLLPLQDLSATAFEQGIAECVIDRAGSTPLLPFGHMQRMRAIGIDTVRQAVENYRSRMTPEDARDYAALSRFLTGGDKCVRNGNDARGSERDNRAEVYLHKLFMYLAVNTLLRMIESGVLTYDAAERTLSDVYGAERSLRQCLEELNAEEAVAFLAYEHERTGKGYFSPGALWRGSCAE